MDCQTDAFLDKPATPLFIPAKTGKDVGTQIEEGEVGDPAQELWPLWSKMLSVSSAPFHPPLRAWKCAVA